MMRTTYSSPHIDLSGWYAYRRPPGERVIWDGGLRREFWDEQWRAVSVPESLKNCMPNMPLEGYLHEDYLHVTALPDADILNKIVKADNRVEMETFEVLQGGKGCFVTEFILMDQKILGNDHYGMVPLRILPDNREESRKCFLSLGLEATARHPLSVWCNGHSLYAVQDHARFTRTDGRLVGESLYCQDSYLGRFPHYKVPEGAVTLVYDSDSLVGIE